MNQQEVEKNLLQLVRETVLKDSPELTPDTVLISSGQLDSLGVFTLIEAIEKAFAVRFEVDELAPENFDSVLLASQMVLKKINSSAESK